MFLNEKYWTVVKSEIIKTMKNMGFMDGWKKLDLKPESKEKIKVFKVFHTILELLEKEKAYVIQSPEPIDVPVFVIGACQFLRQNLRIEGLFRIAGSAAQQRDLMTLLDSGNRLAIDDDLNVNVVANTLKTFFRELPEPLIPHKFHSLFLKCLNNNENCVEAILMACLLLPISHLNTLCYIMQFLHDVSQHSHFNKMDDGNLSIIFAPTFMPPKSRKITRQTSLDINQRMKIIQILIQHSIRIGIVPDNVCERLGLHLVNLHSITDDEQTNAPKPKKRKSSVTRVMDGIRKIMRRPSFDSSSSHSTCSIPPLRMRSYSSTFSDTLKRPLYLGSALRRREFSDNVVRTNSGNFNAVIDSPPKQPNVCLPNQSEPFDVAPNWENEFLEIKKRLFLLENSLNRQRVSPLREANLSGTDRNIYLTSVQRDAMDTLPMTSAMTSAPQEEMDVEVRQRNLPIRSPSARKIGSFRNKKRVSRHSSLNFDVRPTQRRHDQSKRLRRGKPNTVYSGLPHPLLLSDAIAPSPSYSSISSAPPPESFPSTLTTHLRPMPNLRPSLNHPSTHQPSGLPTSSAINNPLSVENYVQQNTGYVVQKARMFGDLSVRSTYTVRKNHLSSVPMASPIKALPLQYSVKERAPTVSGYLPTYRSPRIKRPSLNQ